MKNEIYYFSKVIVTYVSRVFIVYSLTFLRGLGMWVWPTYDNISGEATEPQGRNSVTATTKKSTTAIFSCCTREIHTVACYDLLGMHNKRFWATRMQLGWASIHRSRKKPVSSAIQWKLVHSRKFLEPSGSGQSIRE